MLHNFHLRLVHHLRNNFRDNAIPCSGDSRYRRWHCLHDKSHVRVRSRQHQYQRRPRYSNRSERIYWVIAYLHPRNLAGIPAAPDGSCNNILYIHLAEHVFPRNSVFLADKRQNEESTQVDSILQRHSRS